MSQRGQTALDRLCADAVSCSCAEHQVLWSDCVLRMSCRQIQRILLSRLHLPPGIGPKLCQVSHMPALLAGAAAANSILPPSCVNWLHCTQRAPCATRCSAPKNSTVAAVHRYVWEAVSHEVGHTLGLSHDGQTGGPAYYEGQGSW